MPPNQPTQIRPSSPATWPKPVCQAVDAIAAVLMATCMLFRSRPPAHPAPTVQALGERDHRAWNEALLQRECGLLRGRLEGIPSHRRPLYSPEGRYEVL